MLNIDDRLIKEVSPKIGPNALSVLLAIAIHLNQKTNRCFPSHHRIMSLTGLGRDAVYSALSRLQKEGLLQSEQKIDSEKKTFSKRVFRVSTRFIRVFVCAEDMEPLPENPYTANPHTDEPYTANPETYLINHTQQINQFEQINNVGVKAHTPEAKSSTLEEKKPNSVNVPPPPPAPWSPVNPEAEIEKMRTDFTCIERFAKDSRTATNPEIEFAVALEDFALVVKSEKKTYAKASDLRGHFFNWLPFRQKRKEMFGGSDTATTTSMRKAKPGESARLHW